MKHLLASALALILLSVTTRAATWMTDFEAAKTLAAKEKKLMLLDFTGSDWCSWCIKMKKETLDQADFKTFADKNLILVELDFPQRKKLPAAIAKQNDALMKKYGVQGFPCYVVLDGTGKELGRQSGYLKGGPSAFISLIEGFRTKAK